MADIVQAIAAFFGFMHALAVALLLHSFDMQKVAGYAIFIDVAATVAFSWMYHGTYTGTSVGIFAGLFMTLYLHHYKTMNGYKKLQRDGLKWHWYFYHNNPEYDDWNVGVRCK